MIPPFVVCRKEQIFNIGAAIVLMLLY